VVGIKDGYQTCSFLNNSSFERDNIAYVTCHEKTDHIANKTEIGVAKRKRNIYNSPTHHLFA